MGPGAIVRYFGIKPVCANQAGDQESAVMDK